MQVGDADDPGDYATDDVPRGFVSSRNDADLSTNVQFRKFGIGK